MTIYAAVRGEQMKSSCKVKTIVAMCVLLAAATGHCQQSTSSIGNKSGDAMSHARAAATPGAAMAVTTTGGTTAYLPRFSGTAALVNSEVYDTGTTVGIGVGAAPNASVKLDTGGGMIVRGNTIVSRTGNATSSKDYPSWGFQFFSNAYNSSTKAGDNPYFSLQSEPTGNNTASPSATFNLLFSNHGEAAAETGFYVNPNGTLHFAAAQTFPIAAGPQGATGPKGPTGPAGPTGPTGDTGPASPQYFTSTTLLQPFITNVDQYGAVMGLSNAMVASDYYGQYKTSLVFANACTASNFKVNLGYESLTSPFVLTTTLRVGGTNTALTCDSGFATGYGFSCISNATYDVPAGSQVTLAFSHTGTDPSDVYPQVTFTCQ
jgi:hypothetical protein